MGTMYPISVTNDFILLEDALTTLKLSMNQKVYSFEMIMKKIMHRIVMFLTDSYLHHKKSLFYLNHIQEETTAEWNWKMKSELITKLMEERNQ